MRTMEADTIIKALEGKREGNSWRCDCPVHPGQRHFIVSPNGETVLLHCHVGASQDEVIAALQERSLWGECSEHNPEPVTGRPEAEYQYMASDGAAVAIKGRFRKPNGEKSFAWKRPDADDWSGLKGLQEKELPLYNAHLIPTSDGPVLIVEGEKAANACLDAALLAVCPPGGAAAKDFGRQLEPLAGRDVILWPDNDDAGRALMQRLSVKLAGVAASVRTVGPDVSAKGDAFDYFHNGGTKDLLLAEANKIRIKPWLEKTADGYLVGIPHMGGAALFRFARLEERTHVLQAEVSCRLEIAGMSREPFSARLNLLSISNREAFRRQLEDVMEMGKGTWTRLLGRACEMVRDAHASSDPSIDLATVPDVPAATLYLAAPLVLADAPTVHFGDGGTCKTLLALRIGVSVGLGVDLLGVKVRKASVLYIDYEASEVTIKRRLLRILAGMEVEYDHFPLIYWPARGRSLPEMVPALQRKLRDADVGLLIVDSAAYAAGAEPEKADSAIRYFNALAALEVPSLTLAHVGKENRDEWPFGSIFWHNGPRLTWNTKASREDGSNVTHMGLFNRKSNEDALQRPIGICLEFDADCVRFSREELQAGISDRANLTARILAELRPGARSVKQIAQELDADTHAIRTRLNQMSGVWHVGRADDASGLWGLKAK